MFERQQEERKKNKGKSRELFCPFSGRLLFYCLQVSEAVVRRCSIKKVFLEISQNSQVLSCAFCEICKNTFFNRTRPSAACKVFKRRLFSKKINRMNSLRKLVDIWTRSWPPLLVLLCVKKLLSDRP